METPLDFWYTLTLDTNESIFLSLETLVLEAADRFNELISKGIMDIWHYRYDSSWISFRVRAIEKKKNLLSSELKQIGNCLCENNPNLIHSDEKRKWYSDWNSVIEAHKSEKRWILWMESLYHLTKTVESLMRADMSYWKGVHQYFNMIGWQEMGTPYVFSTETHGEFKAALGTDGYQTLLNYASQLYSDYASTMIMNIPIYAALLHPRLAFQKDIVQFKPVLMKSETMAIE